MKVINKVSAIGLAGLVALVTSSVRTEGGCCEGGTDQGAVCTGAVCSVEKAGGATVCVMTSLSSGTLKTAGLQELIKAKTPAAILDARSGKYDDGKRIPGATQLSPTAEDADIAKVLPDKKAMIVTYCAGLKCPASKMLADKLRKLGYTNVLEYPEGIEGWIAAGNTVEQKGN